MAGLREPRRGEDVRRRRAMRFRPFSHSAMSETSLQYSALRLRSASNVGFEPFFGGARERFLARRAEAVELFDERFARLWEYYLGVSELAFRYQGMMVFQIQVARRQDAAVGVSEL